MAAPHNPLAQTIAQPRHAVLLQMGLAHALNRDGSISPLAYGGVGLSVGVGYERASRLRRIEIAVRGALPTLTSDKSQGGAPRQDVLQVELLFGMGWRVRSDTTLPQLFLGPRLSLNTVFRNHVYPTVLGGDDSGYLFMNLALGPEIAGESRIGANGRFRYALAVPLIALVEHPYSDIRLLVREGLNPRVATVTTFNDAELTLGYDRPFARRAAWLARWRMRFTRYDGHDSYRAMATVLDFGIAIGRMGQGW